MGGVCRPCRAPCASCRGTTSTCTTCTGNLFLDGANCVDQCPQGSFVQSNRQCAACSSNCRTCSSTADNCLTCDSVTPYLNDNRCLAVCLWASTLIPPTHVSSAAPSVPPATSLPAT